MSWTEFFIFAALAVVVTVPIILWMPRARQSPLFDRLLWMGTAVVAFLSAWLAVAIATENKLRALTEFKILEVSLFPAIIGTVIGALLLNLPLWALDWFDPPAYSSAAEDRSLDNEMMPESGAAENESVDE